MSSAGLSWVNDPSGYIQSLLGSPVTVTSGLRSPAHNMAVGGVPNSDHLAGSTYDFVPQGMPMQDAFAALQASGAPIKQSLNEGNHIHVAFDQNKAPPVDSIDAMLAAHANPQQQQGQPYFPPGDSRNGPAAMTVGPAANADPLDAALAQQAASKASPVDAADLPKIGPKSQTLGFEQGVGNFLSNAATPAIWAGKKLGLDMSGFEKGQDRMRHPANPDNATPGAIGQFAGQLPAYLGLSPVMGPFSSGFVGGALNSDKSTPEGIATDATISGVAGKAGDAVLGAAKNVLSPVVKPAVQSLLDAKIPLTLGQTVGGAMHTAEDKLTSLPLLGGMIQGAKDRSVIGLNKAVYNRVLQPVGETLPSTVSVGREAVDHIATVLGDKYDALLPNMQANIADPQFGQDMRGVLADAKAKLPEPQFARLSAIVQNQFGKADATGAINGDALKGIHSELSRLSGGLGGDPSFDNRELAGSIGDVQASLRDLVTRQNPDQAPQLKAIDTAYANFVRLRKAASAVGARDGIFSAPQLASAVRAADKSAGKGAYARGNALMQDLSDPANSVLPSHVPDSGTAGRSLLPMLIAGGAYLNPKLAAPVAAGAALYTVPGQAAARGILAGARPSWAPAAAKTVNMMRLPLRVGASALAPALIPPNN